LKNKWLKAILFSAIGIILIVWVFRTLEAEFTTISIQRLKEAGLLLSQSVPSRSYDQWVSATRQQYPDILPFISEGNAEFGEEVRAVISSAADQAFFDWAQSLPFYDYGLESTYYEEVYFYPTTDRMGRTPGLSFLYTDYTGGVRLCQRYVDSPT